MPRFIGSGGFSGLWALRALRNAPVRITLIDRRNHHLFQPLLYRLAAAGLSPDIAALPRHILRHQYKAGRSRAGRCTASAAASGRRPRAGLRLAVAAAGHRRPHAYFGHADWAHHASGLKTLGNVLNIRRRLLMAFERAKMEADPQARQAWLDFAIVSGGPTGVELAGTLAEIARHTLRDGFRHIDPKQARIRLIEAGPRVLPSFPQSLADKARKQLEKLGVEAVTGTPVSEINAEGCRPARICHQLPG